MVEINMRLLVCGDRNWTNYSKILKEIKELQPTVIIEGAARGADSMAAMAARRLRIPLEEYPAKWNTYGRGAGPIRNKQMLDEGKPDMILAFHSNLAESKGTRDMVERGRKAGIPVTVIE